MEERAPNKHAVEEMEDTDRSGRTGVQKGMMRVLSEIRGDNASSKIEQKIFLFKVTVTKQNQSS